jgi:hypothetical protein
MLNDLQFAMHSARKARPVRTRRLPVSAASSTRRREQASGPGPDVLAGTPGYTQG